MFIGNCLHCPHINWDNKGKSTIIYALEFVCIAVFTNPGSLDFVVGFVLFFVFLHKHKESSAYSGALSITVLYSWEPLTLFRAHRAKTSLLKPLRITMKRTNRQETQRNGMEESKEREKNRQRKRKRALFNIPLCYEIIGINSFSI